MTARKLNAVANSVLVDIFLSVLNGKGYVNAITYAINNKIQIQLLDALASAQFLIRQDDTRRVSFQALCFMRHQEVQTALHRCGIIFGKIFESYCNEKTRDQGIKLSALAKELRYPSHQFYFYVELLLDVKGLWCGGGTNLQDLSGSFVRGDPSILYNPTFDQLVNKVLSWYEKGTGGLGTVPLIWEGSDQETEVEAERTQFGQGETSFRHKEYVLKDILHPIIVEHAFEHFQAGHLREAVLNSMIAVFDLIRTRTGLSGDGEQLVTTAFSQRDPYLILSELESESGKNDQVGFMDIYRGAFKGIRNPKAHSLTHDLDQLKAAQYLVLASLLARRIDEARLVKHAKPKTGINGT